MPVRIPRASVIDVFGGEGAESKDGGDARMPRPVSMDMYVGMVVVRSAAAGIGWADRAAAQGGPEEMVQRLLASCFLLTCSLMRAHPRSRRPPSSWLELEPLLRLKRIALLLCLPATSNERSTTRDPLFRWPRPSPTPPPH